MCTSCGFSVRHLWLIDRCGSTHHHRLRDINHDKGERGSHLFSVPGDDVCLVPWDGPRDEPAQANALATWRKLIRMHSLSCRVIDKVKATTHSAAVFDCAIRATDTHGQRRSSRPKAVVVPSKQSKEAFFKFRPDCLSESHTVLSLQRCSALPSSSSRPCLARARATGPNRKSLRVVAAAAGQQTAGPTCRALLGLKDSSWKALLEAATPGGSTPVFEPEAALEALYQQLGGSRAQVVGSEAAGTRVLWATTTITVVHPKYNPAKPSDLVAAVAKTLSGVEAYSSIVSRATHVEFTSKLSGSSRRIRLIPTDVTSADAVQLLNPTLSSSHRQALSASTISASTVFLQQQPALYKLAARLVKKWVGSTLQLQEVAGPGNRSLGYLLDLLVLCAFQTCLGASAPGRQSILADNQSAALDAILQNFLHLAAGLPTPGIISWEYLYTQGTVQQALLCPELASVLRPAEFEGHPVVLDPADPTNNVALALSQDGLCHTVDASSSSSSSSKSAGSTVPVAVLRAVDNLQEEVNSRQEQVEALRLQQRMLQFGGGTWDLEGRHSVREWLPLARKPARVLSTLTDSDAPGLCMRLIPVPLQQPDSSDRGLMGVELRLSDDTSLLKALAIVPIPVTICEGSQFIVESRASSLSVSTDLSFATANCIELDRNISGKLGIESGVRWLLSRDQLHKLGLCTDDAELDVGVLKARAKASCTVKFKLMLKWGRYFWY